MIDKEIYTVEFSKDEINALSKVLDRKFYVTGLAGATLLLLGLFLPAIKRLDKVNSFIQYFPVEGILLLFLVAFSIFVLWRRKFRLLIFVGAVSLGIILFSYVKNENHKDARISEAQRKVPTKIDETDPKLRALLKTINEGYPAAIRREEEKEEYKLGWFLMIAGSFGLLTSGVMSFSSVEKWFIHSESNKV